MKIPALLTAVSTRLRDIAGHRDDHRVVALGDGAGVGDHRITELAVGRHQALPDAL
jgi:hypothetical protein